MQTMIDISHDRSRHAPLAMEPEAFRILGHQLVDQIADLIAGIPSRPVTPNLSPSAVRDAFDLAAPLPEHGVDAGTLLTETSRRLFDCSLFNAHPRFFGTGRDLYLLIRIVRIAPAKSGWQQNHDQAKQNRADAEGAEERKKISTSRSSSRWRAFSRIAAHATPLKRCAGSEARPESIRIARPISQNSE